MSRTYIFKCNLETAQSLNQQKSNQIKLTTYKNISVISRYVLQNYFSEKKYMTIEDMEQIFTTNNVYNKYNFPINTIQYQ